MNIKLEKLAAWVVCGLFALTLLGLLAALIFPKFPLSGYVSAISTFVIAIMTVEYVVTTKRQFSVMEKQLVEMKLDRELGDQPVPVIVEPEFVIEKPRLFHSPRDNYVSCKSRYLFNYSINNRGIPPAVNVIVTGQLLVPGNDKPLVLKSASENINVLESGSRYPIDKEDFFSFMYPLDDHHVLLTALRDSKPKENQTLVVRIVYKNVLGACFMATSYFYVYVNESKAYGLLGQWHSRLVSFPVEFKSEIENIRKLRSKENDSWRESFDNVNQFFSEPFSEDEDQKISCIEIPNSFELKVITEQQFNEHGDQSWFGSPVPEWVTECLSESKRETNNP